jgi:hypothetical protein
MAPLLPARRSRKTERTGGGRSAPVLAVSPIGWGVLPAWIVFAESKLNLLMPVTRAPSRWSNTGAPELQAAKIRGMKNSCFALFALFALLAACGGRSDAPADASVEPADAFMQRLATHCGQAFEGEIVANEPQAEDDPFVGKTLVMHVRECSDRELKVPFHVGDDHSRTWVLTRTDTGLRLKHDHRHEDGSEDALTMYGGDTVGPGSERRQEFPVDQFSKDLFEREGRQVSMTNTWAMEIEPGEKFVYELSRPGRLFKVEFDLTRPVATPPTPWGHPELPDQW